MIGIENLTVSFGGFTLLNSISFVINRKDRIALVGKNGAGKSTLLKIVAGIQNASSGVVSLPNEVTIGYLPQHMIHADSRTVRQEAELAFSSLFEKEAAIARMNEELSTRTDYESGGYHRLIERLSEASEELSMIGGMNYHAELEKTLFGLGFRREDLERQTAEFSGGWRMRIELAKLLLQRPDVLLLDEPTNHLDIEAIQWLEQFLSTRVNAVVLVSHDRAFIDNVTTRTIEISLGRIYDYKVNYSKYVILREEHRAQQLRAYENQQKLIAETEDFIERFRYKATKAVQVQSRIKQLERLDLLEVDEVDGASLHLRFPPAPRSGDFPILADEVAKRYGDHLVFGGANFQIRRGDKVAFVGQNGAGKTTMVRCIMGNIPFEGSLRIGYNVKIGYFAQNQASLLDDNMTVFETIDYVAQGDIRTQIRNILGAFMFGGDVADKKVSVLSGGERSRLAMIRLLLEPVNLLILDEPTNHLDMRSKDVLKAALRDFEGTVIVVSHDREFLDGLVDKVYEFSNGQVHEHLGGIYDFLARRKIESLRVLEEKRPNESIVTGSPTVSEVVSSDSKLSYEARKELGRKIKRVEKQIGEDEKQVASLEASIEEIEVTLSTPEGSSDTDLYWKHGELKKKLDNAMEQWTLHTLELEELQEQA